jgi:glycosyltransferase involved in cell wall biosynthesis
MVERSRPRGLQQPDTTGPPSPPPLISVVVPTYGRRDSVLRLLRSLRAQSLPAHQFEAIVVIDGSNDGTREAVAEFEAAFPLSWIWQENRGRAAAVNAGLRMAHGDLVVLLDDDMEPTPDLLSAHLRAHRDGKRRGVVGAAPCRLDPSTPPFARFRSVQFNGVQAELSARPHGLTYRETYTGNFSARRSDFLEVGGFDETFDGFGLEDYELALRLSSAGVELVLCTEAVAHQHYEKDFSAAARHNEAGGRSAVIFATLHPTAPADFGPRDYGPPSVARRVFRNVLPRASRILPFLPSLVVRLVGIAERLRFKRLEFVYTLGLEYFFLLGFREASRDRKLTARTRRW